MARTAGATPWWVAWEGETYPEDDGWSRLVYGGGNDRWFENGAMVLDAQGDPNTVDEYGMQRPLTLNPGERFLLEWNVRIDSVVGFTDPGVNVEAPGHGLVFMEYTNNSIYSGLEGVWIPFMPGVFHNYALSSDDMVSYELRIDAQLAYTGHFIGPSPESGVGWGDCGLGSASASVWDRVAFGIVPDPPAGNLLVSAGLAWLVFKGRRTGRNSL
jgi:hypothetical protein